MSYMIFGCFLIKWPMCVISYVKTDIIKDAINIYKFVPNVKS